MWWCYENGQRVQQECKICSGLTEWDVYTDHLVLKKKRIYTSLSGVTDNNAFLR